MGEAQSGRRAKRPDANVSPAPAIEPDPAQQAPAASVKPEVPKQKLIAGMDNLGRSINVPQYMVSAVWDGFMNRFSKLSSLRVTTENMRRKDAIERAKKETESYVVLLEVETEYLDSGSAGQANYNDLIVSYNIFSPVTGKIKTSGHVYVRQSRSILGGGLPTGRIGDSQLYQAGRETADRVISALSLGSAVLSR